MAIVDNHIQVKNGMLLIDKDFLLDNNLYSNAAYRQRKSRGILKEKTINGDKWTALNSLPKGVKDRVLSTFTMLGSEQHKLLTDVVNSNGDVINSAITVTAQTLDINLPFIISELDAYINSHFVLYTTSYLEMNISAESVRNYSKQCALVEWCYIQHSNIENNTHSEKECEIMLRSFRMNLLTAIKSKDFGVKIPMSEARFNQWFDNIIKQRNKGVEVTQIIRPKRANNTNSQKITPEQIDVAVEFHTNGMNMSVKTVYKKWKKFGKQNGWWMIHDKFCPPTESRLYQIFQNIKNPLQLEKTDQITYRSSVMPTVTRALPDKKNHIWVIDGTAHNENVKFSGKVRQHVYTIKIMDVTTMRIVGVSSLIGVKEPFFALRDAILMGIAETGYKPAYIHSDHGPAWRELEEWCYNHGIKLYTSFVGNARAKTIESMFNMFDNDITRYLDGYSGQNRTARSLNSRSSEKRETEGKRNARDAKTAMKWLKTEGIRLWNERVIETLEGQTCNKTPMELWDEKESYTPEIPYSELCVMCGTLHERKLTITGLEIEHNKHRYIYFPPIKTSAQREVAEKIFTTTPMNARTANKFKIYILKGGEPAAVFNNDNVFVGLWQQKEKVAFMAESKEEKEALDNFMALQYRIEARAREINEGFKKRIEMHPQYEEIEAISNEPLTGKHRPYTGRYDKTALLEEEQESKAEDILNGLEEPEFKELVDPDTGEIIYIQINKN